MHPIIRLHKNGKYWSARWKVGDTPRSRGLGTGTREEAEVRWQELIGRMAQNPALALVGNDSPTLDELKRGYGSARTELNHQTISAHEWSIGLIAEFLGDDQTKISAVTPTNAADFANWLRQRVKRNGELPTESHVRSVLARAKQVFGWAVKSSRLASNPFQAVRSTQPALHQDWEYVSLETLDKVLAAADPDWQRVFLLARLAGLRANEIAALTWGNVDLSAAAITVQPASRIQGTKKRYRRVPIEPRLLASLVQGRGDKADDDLVCAVSGDLTSGARAIMNKAGVEWAKPLHTLRKSRETDWLARFPLPDTCEWLGHSAKVALEHYFKSQKSTFSLVTGVDTTLLKSSSNTTCP